jgi:hypothetical protein
LCLQPDQDWAVEFRNALNANGYANTRVIAMDGQFDEVEWNNATANATVGASFDGVGLHYPCDKPHPEVQAANKLFWASEDYSRDPAWSNGGSYWLKALSQNYVLMNMTSTISWSLIWSAYTNLVCNGAGLMRAHEPWSNNYEASAPIWGSAHYGQFVTPRTSSGKPGWRYLHVPGGSSGFLPGNGGTYVSLVPPAGAPAGLSIVIETLYNNDCQARNYSDYSITFNLKAGTNLPGPGTVFQVWMTTSEAYFVRQTDVTVAADGSLTVQVPADAMVTVSTTTGAQRGDFPSSPIPESQPFPIPYSDDFSSYPYDAMAKYFSDQGGSWAVRNGSLVQVAPANPGPNGWAANPDPLTQIGGESWTDYTIAATVTFSSATAGVAADADADAEVRATGVVAGAVKGVSSEYVKLRERNAAQRRELMEARLRALGRPLDMLPSKESLKGTTAVFLDTCDPTQPAQKWQFNQPAAGYISSAGTTGLSVPAACLNLGGCLGNDVIAYDCLTSGGTCCGADCYQNLQWNLTSQGQLLSALTTEAGQCLTDIGNGQMNMSACISPLSPSQTWSYDASTGLLSVDGQCLSTPPTYVYAQVCARITSFNGFSAQSAMDGYCLWLDEHGKWKIVSAGVSLLSGNFSGQGTFTPTTPHTLQLEVAGPVITAWIDNQQVGQVINTTFAYGNAALGCGWHACSFDNFSATPPSYAGNVDKDARAGTQ